MPVRLQRKARKKRVKAAKRKAAIKRLLFMPVMKCLDVEAMRQDFQNNSSNC